MGKKNFTRGEHAHKKCSQFLFPVLGKIKIECTSIEGKSKFFLNDLNSLEFTFVQLINKKTEEGSCLLEFPGKLKCNYFDDKKKELMNKM